MGYVTKIKVAGKTLHLGYFARKSEADIVFKAAAKVPLHNRRSHQSRRSIARFRPDEQRGFPRPPEWHGGGSSIV
jgi:hypothetical protein